MAMAARLDITFLRHGRSRADDEGTYEGRYDSPLTEAGRAQVRARASAWQASGEHYDCVICSTLQRAHETARIMAEALQAPLEPDPDWMEMDAGRLAGLDRKTADALYPRPAFRNPYEPICETGESEWDIYTRAARAVQNVIRRGPGCYLVVAHGGILNAALRCILGAQPPVNNTGAWFAFGDVGYVRATYYPETHRWVIRELTREEE
jgi:2,3-bisphosphoglycerate-dependent phosphoglycerate mutase